MSSGEADRVFSAGTRTAAGLQASRGVHTQRAELALPYGSGDRDAVTGLPVR